MKRINLFLGLKQISIKQKIIMITMIITSISLLIACFSFLLYDKQNFQNRMVSDLSIRADVIGDGCKASISFLVPSDAKEHLHLLKADDQIIAAMA